MDFSELETIEPYCKAPWNLSFETTLQRREEAVEWANVVNEGILSGDTSCWKGNISLRIYSSHRRDRDRLEDKQCLRIGRNDQITVYHAELIAFLHATARIRRHME